MADKHFLDYDGLNQFFNGLKQKFYQKPSDGIPKTDLADAVQTSLGKADNALPKSGGTMSGAINMNSKKITSLATPTNNADAATKKYVDDSISSSTAVSSVNGKNGAVVLEPQDLSFPNDYIVEPFRTKSLDNVVTILYASAGTLASDIESMQSDLNGKASTSYVNSAISTALTSAVVYKGTKAAVANLPSTGNKVGDMWNVSADGMNYVWDGSKWDAQGATFSVTAITNDEITAILNGTS